MASSSEPTARPAGAIDQRPKRRVRVTVPLLNTAIKTDSSDAPAQGRLEIATGVWLAALDEAECQRVAEAVGFGRTIGNACRLELHDVEVATRVETDPYDYFVDDRPIKRVQTCLGLLSLSVRMAPTWPGVVYDVRQPMRWERFAHVFVSGGFRNRKFSYLPLKRIETWGALVANWPDPGEDPVGLALAYYYDSVVDRPESTAKALISASIAFECLLSDRARSNSRHLAQRGALLVAEGADAKYMFDFLRKAYAARSSVVHEGKIPEGDLVVRFQQYLMRAIPSMAHLTYRCGSHASAIGALDQAAFGDRLSVEGLFVPGQWWNYVDVPTALRRPAL